MSCVENNDPQRIILLETISSKSSREVKGELEGDGDSSEPSSGDDSVRILVFKALNVRIRITNGIGRIPANGCCRCHRPKKACVKRKGRIPRRIAARAGEIVYGSE